MGWKALWLGIRADDEEGVRVDRQGGKMKRKGARW
jgi:hypothetical protein